MKQFFSRSLHWHSPLEIFPLVAKKNAHLFFSGSSENADNLGNFSFIPFSPSQYWEISDEKKKDDWENMQQKFLDIQQKYSAEIAHHTDWNFPFMGGIAGVFSYDFMRTFEDIPLNTKNNISKNPLAILGLYETFFCL